ncbi:SinI family autotransporter-associated protein, partial [Escherichia coli]|uniref:SinI family autotransporter-associated protein n=1 Tax=Escherichia coli TaxID=562 RepID=UPI000A64CB00
MKQDKRRGLTRIALALALAGYCVAPVALAEESAWVDSGETNIFQGTIPWLYSEGGSATTDADHVTLTSDLKGARPTGSETDKRLYSGDKLTVSWEIGDTEGDVDLGGLGDNAKTIDTIRWMSYKDAQGGDPKELATKVTSYTLTDDDRGRYIGIEITPTTQTGTPNVGTALHLYDISTASGGGSDSDNVAPGPVVNQNLKVIIGGNVSIGTRIKLAVFVLIRVQFGHVGFAKFDWRAAVDKVDTGTINKDGDFQVLVNHRPWRNVIAVASAAAGSG